MLDITGIMVTLTHSADPVKGYAQVVLADCFVVNKIAIVEGKFGMFISFPREYNKEEGKGYNLCYPITKNFQEAISKAILAEFDKVKAASKAIPGQPG